MSTMTYKGFAARVEYSPDDEAFVGQIAGINDIVGFHADTVAGLTTAFHEAVDDYVEACASAGKTPEKSFSGRVMFRVAPEVHAAAAKAAELTGVSLNEWAEAALRDAATAAIVGRPAAAIPESSPLYSLLRLFNPDQALKLGERGVLPPLLGAAPQATHGRSIFPAAEAAKVSAPAAKRAAKPKAAAGRTK